MKTYVTEKSITVTGRAWQVLAILKKYEKQHRTVKQWIDSVYIHCNDNDEKTAVAIPIK